MGGIPLGILGNILRIYGIYRFFEMLYETKKINKVLKILCYTGFVIITSSGFYLTHNPYVNLAANILGMLILSLLYQGKIKRKIVVIVCVYVLNVIIEGLVMFSLPSYPKQDTVAQGISMCIAGLGMMASVAVFERTIAMETKEFHLPLKLWLCLLAVPIISFLLMLRQAELRIVNGETVGGVIAGILFINVLIFYLYGTLQDYYKSKAEKAKFQERVEQYRNQLEVMANSYEQIRNLKHDLRHHITELRYFIYHEQKKEALSYLERIEQHIINPAEYSATGNQEIDSMLNCLLYRAEKLLNKVEIQICIPDTVKLDDFSMNVILGNLLENATEAARNSVEKYLFFKMTMKKNAVFIKIENSYEGKVRVIDKRFLTNKKEETEHGIGLQSVKRIIDELGGDMDIRWSEDLFGVTVVLFLE